MNNITRRMEAMSERSLNIIHHIGWSMVFKLGSIVANFMLVPMAIAYLGAEDYGVWLTLSSVLAWFMLFDIGLGNGLRNKFAAAKALGNDSEARAFVSTAYFTIAMISAVMVLVMWLVNSIFDWAVIFNAPAEKASELKLLMPVVFGFFGLQLVVKLVTSIYQADQHHSIQDKTQFFIQSLALLGIYVLSATKTQSLLHFSIIYTASPVIVFLLLNWHAFTGKYKAYRPAVAFVDKKHMQGITGLGAQFFILQLSVVVLFTTDNIIISHLFSPAEVTPYQVTLKYFSISLIVFSIIVNPYWSAITNAATLNDYAWIKTSITALKKLWLIGAMGSLVLAALFNPMLKIWVGDAVTVQKELVIQGLLFSCLQSYNMIYTHCLNGLGKVKVQMITSMFSVAFNIPLSILFAKHLAMGLPGVLLATNISILLYIITRQYQYHRIIQGADKGLWSK